MQSSEKAFAWFLADDSQEILHVRGLVKIAQRIGAAAGVAVNDKDGNERGGLGVLDNDSRVVMGLDYPSGAGEAITLAVVPGEGPSLQLKDTSTLVRTGLLLDKPHSTASAPRTSLCLISA